MFRIGFLLCSFLLLLSLLLAPWLFGGYPEWARLWLALPITAACCLSLLWVCKAPFGHQVSSIALCLLGLIFYFSFQLAPVSSPALSRLEHPVLASFLAEESPVSRENDHHKRSAISVSPWRTISETGVYGISLILLITTSFLLSFSSRFGTVLLTTLMFNGVAISLYGMYQKLRWGHQIFGFLLPEQGGQPFASFVNRNNAAAYLLICFAAGIGLLFMHREQAEETDITAPREEKRRQERAIIAGISLAVIAAGIVASLSRSGSLSLLTGLLVLALLFWHRSQSFSLLLLLATGLWGMMILSFGWLNESLARFLEIDQETIRLGRIDHWQHTAAAWPDFGWLGSGLGTYRDVNRPYQTLPVWFVNADNQYVEWGLELGIVGSLFLMAMLSLLVWKNSRLFRNRLLSPRYAGAGAMLAFLLASQLTHAIFDFGITLPAVQWTAIVVCAIALSPLYPPANLRKRRYSSQPAGTRPRGIYVPNIVWGLWAVPLAAGSCLVLFMSAQAEQIQQATRSVIVAKPDTVTAKKTAVEILISQYEQRFPRHSEVDQSLVQLAEHNFRQAFLVRLKADNPQQPERQWQRLAELRQIAFSSLGLQVAQDQLQLIMQEQPLRDSSLQLENTLQESLAQTPLRGDHWGKLAIVRWLNGKPTTEILEAGRWAAVLRPFDTESLLLYALLLSDAGNPTDAWPVYSILLKQSAPNWQQIWNAARRHHSLETIADHIVPDDPAIWLGLMQVIRAPEEKEEFARKAIQRQQAVTENSATKFYLLGMSCVILQKPAEAVEALTEAVNRNPLSALWRLELARQLFILSRYDTALEQLGQANRLAPENREIQQAYKKALAESASP